MNCSCQLIYGTAWKRNSTKNLVVLAILNGFRAIDTACQLKHYREDLVGEALSELQREHKVLRKDLFLQTKFTSIAGQDRNQFIPYSPAAPIPEQIHSSLNKSLENLGVDYVDSYILHSPLRTLSNTLVAWRTLIELQNAKNSKVKRIGISNIYDVDVLKAMEREGKPVEVVQNRWFEGNGWDRDVVQYCTERGIQYQSFWTLTGSPSLLDHPSTLALSERIQLTPAQVVYLFAQSLGITPISGTTSEVHMKQDAGLQSLGLGMAHEQEFKELRSFIWP